MCCVVCVPTQVEPAAAVADIKGSAELTMEEAKRKAEADEVAAAANAKKMGVREQLAQVMQRCHVFCFSCCLFGFYVFSPSLSLLTVLTFS